MLASAVILPETDVNQAVTTSGASPSSKPGRPARMIQASASLGRLISPSRLPAMASSERFLVLLASSSASPARGSMIMAAARCGRR